MNLKAEDQRTSPRVVGQFRAMVSGSVESEGTGTVLDLSRSGCRLESPLLMLPGLSLELRIAVPGLEWALVTEMGSGLVMQHFTMQEEDLKVHEIQPHSGIGPTVHTLSFLRRTSKPPAHETAV